jgi:hypothetical protein
MKKILSLFLFAVLFNSNGNSQTTVPITTQPTCSCNPTGWQPGTATINNVSKPITCGYQFSLKCNDVINIQDLYKCIGTCVVKYTAVLKNTATGAVVVNYPAFTFPWSYTFTAAGNYSLEITPICGTAKCTPCRFFFTVTCPTAACDCKTDGWQPFTATVSGKPPMTVKCGHQFGFKKTEPFKLAGKYICKGDCPAKYSAELKNSATGAVVMSNPAFTFPWNYAFAASGNYKLEITPICGNKRCQPCIFYFTIY